MALYSNTVQTGAFETRAQAMGACHKAFWTHEPFGIEYDLIGCLDAPEWVPDFGSAWAKAYPDRVEVLMMTRTLRSQYSDRVVL